MQKYGELLQLLLGKRGITDENQAQVFLNPDYARDFHDPFLMRDMEKACVRLYEAIDAGEKIVIYADYDCDGIPGALILRDLFKKVDYKNFEVYIPKRNSEGYGLNLSAMKQFAENGVKLIITVDLGITAVAEVTQAEVNGIDVIIMDHHLSSAVLPRAYAILNPKIDDYPEKMLCGAGVVFKFIQGFIKKYGEYFKIKNGAEKWMLDMAGLATLSDMVPLLGENRAIAYFGLKVLRKSPRPGLQKLLAKMNIDQKHLTEDDIGFMVTPRLNAASRMDDPMRAFELLSTENEKEADLLADHLSKINDERKLIVASIMREVGRKFETREVKDVIVIGNPSWKVGVLGLVAGKMSDEYKRPVFVWGKDENDLLKGSCRSDGSVSVVELMHETKESFLEFGGHELAGGFTVHNDKIHFLEDALSLSYTKIKRPLSKELNEQADIVDDFSLINMKNWREIEKLAPFGLGNPKPIFLFSGAKVEKIKKFGKNGSGEHLEVTFSDSNNNKAKAISFFSNHESFEVPLSEGLRVNLLATFDLSRFRGREELRLRIVDIC
ncbi:single-stranded-DNA-specific exonuclease RecJ [Candidatus Nomurabacteria bacterium RIFCSPLOWO2_01_FULL_39_17]|uniref:Single-stranded-DNA-specific exonuclease RecJ n=1 Tax=Candidatus Nomurabacteria bacterium RIFCSPLOWO2_01_FULL_39_17 TaxID=1801770 RepID=A0A1F6WW52_9BACT|nr:MAG: single-stranded-DNA-specific exonuclease RecJ [Candidatus Nomurabacteria bacterium RIFCSPLOWO2_01_FULL_39_17]